jgi:hypothetical protein
MSKVSDQWIPSLRYPSPLLTHTKVGPYTDFPLVYNETVTNRPFYIENDCSIVTSDIANTTLSKWNGNSYTAISGLVSPDIIVGRGFFAVTTAANCYVTLTEHPDSD